MRLSARDVIAIALVAILCTALLFLFVREQERVALRSGEKALGTIVFKKLSATRRPAKGLLWERMRNNNPVYQADTLRTGDASEASVCFDDGARLDMLENSMLQLDFSKKGRSFAFLGGTISIRGAAGGGTADLTGLEAPRSEAAGTPAYSVTTGGRTIVLSEGSQASLSRTGTTVAVEVSSGEVGVTDAAGRTETIDPSKGLEIDIAAGTAQVVHHALIPLSPPQNAQLLFEGAGKAELPFSWRSEAVSAATIELSQDEGFDSAVISQQAEGGACRLSLDPGTWYWRVRSSDGGLSAVRRFTLFAEDPPRPIVPADRAVLSYRKSLPSVHFSWSRMENATAYVLEVASDSGFITTVLKKRVSSEGITVSSLAAGAWYWRVSPVYPMSVLGEKSVRQARILNIEKRTEMAKLVPSAPAEDTMFLVQESAEKGVSFSWVPTPEAAEYEVAVSATSDMENASIRRTSTQAWLRLPGSDATPLSKPATWYWAVRWKDDEGNLSSYSTPRRLRGVDGALAVRLVFPPEGYMIADSLISTTRFGWKSYVAANAVFQLSSDKSFSTIAWEEPSDTGTLIGKSWKPGTWYWRIRTVNAEGSVFHDTAARTFTVVDPLPGPTVLSPAPDSAFYLRKDDPYTISWDKVPAADYYQFALYSLEESGTMTLRTSSTLDGTRTEVPLGRYPPGSYRLTLQAFGVDKESSTRLIGFVRQAEFSYKLITRMSLSTPANDVQLDGLDARRRGVRLTWAVPDPPDSSEILISRDPDFRAIVARAAGSSGDFIAARLPAGSYYWSVRGRLCGFDVSAREMRQFTILPIPPLQAPGRLSPTGGHRFTARELRELTAIDFSWADVPGATRYVFELYHGDDTKPAIRTDSLGKPGFALEDFTVLANGDYRWTVTAKAFDPKGSLEQDGIAAESRFSIVVPALRAPALKPKETYYGR
jgi:hypothetical protein